MSVIQSVVRTFHRKVRVEVFNDLEVREITNVFAIIKGQEEPGKIL